MESKSKNILLLGSGLMAESVLTYLLRRPENKVHIASNILIDAKKLAEKKGLDRCTYSEVNVEKPESLAPLVYVTDIVVSYVPAIFHHHIAKVCIDVGRNLVTASYISPELEKMHEAAIKKGLIFLNELGLDPGIDHLATMRTVDQIKHLGGKILEYESWCGGLPSPVNCDNPLGYKFTWSPLGAFRALKNKAVYIEDGKQFTVQPEDLLYSSALIKLNQALTLEGYPNRDSVSYKQVYGLHDAKKVLRGTLRYPGFTEIINAFKEVGIFNENKVQGKNWLQFIQLLLVNEGGNSIQEKIINRTVHKVKHFVNLTEKEKKEKGKRIIDAFIFFGLLKQNEFSNKTLSSLQNLIKLVQPKLSLKEGETDLVAMQHRFTIELNGKRFLRRSSLIQIGEKKGFSAMSLTVGVPTAIGAQLILDNKISERGVIRPVYADIYNPTIKLLEEIGIKLVEVDEDL